MSSLRDQIAAHVRKWFRGRVIHGHELALSNGEASDIAAYAMEIVQPALDAKDAEIAKLNGLLDELRRRSDSWCSHQHITMTRFGEVVAEKLNAVGQRDEATKYARQMIAERDQAEATLERVRAIHQPIPCSNMRHDGGEGLHCSVCSYDDPNGNIWPCPTIRALDEETP